MTTTPRSHSPRKVRTADEARAFLLDRIDYERRPAPVPDAFKLDTIRRLLAALGNPQDRIPAVHVAGTKGKGSTSAMIAAGLVGSDVRTGLFTSPHVDRVEERLRVDGLEATEEAFVAVVARLADLLEGLDLRPTFFETLTALAWMHFEEQQVEVAVMEVGMGGRLDSTNVCRPIVTVVTNVSRDHERLLGDTLGAIAREKAGIVKPGVPCVTGVSGNEPSEVVRDTCRRNGAPLWELDRDVGVTVIGDVPDPVPSRPRIQVATPTAEWPALGLPLDGRHQVTNAALAVGALELVRTNGVVAVDPERSVRGIERLEWPLRFEIVGERPAIVCDAAHNEASVAAVVSTVRDFPAPGPRVLVFASSTDKDHAAMLAEVVGRFDHVVLTRFVENPRAVTPTELASSLSALGPAGHQSFECAETPAEALAAATCKAGDAGLVCVTGSFFLAAECRRMLSAGGPSGRSEASVAISSRRSAADSPS